MKYTVIHSIQKKISICLNRGREESIGNEDVSIICARKYEMVRLGRFSDIYCAIILRYVLSVTFCGAVVLKVMDQKTLVKRR